MERSIAYVKRYLNGPLNHTFYDYVAEKEFHARKAGELKAKKNVALKHAQKMLEKGMSLELTHEITGLPIKDLNKLKLKQLK